MSKMLHTLSNDSLLMDIFNIIVIQKPFSIMSIYYFSLSIVTISIKFAKVNVYFLL